MPQSLNLEQIAKATAGGCELSLLESVDSTNDWVLREARSGAKLPLACFAEEQTRGRGRRGKKWVCPAGAGISMSFAWRYPLPLSEIGGLSLTMGLAIIRTLESIGINNAQLKWPNDVLVAGRKIAGVLIETADISEVEVVAVTGIGLNYDLPDTSSEQPDQPWTDVLSLLSADADMDRSRLAGLLLKHCIMICEHYPSNRGSLLTEYRKYDACEQNAVIVLLGNGEQLEGVACGVTASGEIRVLIKGEERVFNSAEISLRNNLPGQPQSC